MKREPQASGVHGRGTGGPNGPARLAPASRQDRLVVEVHHVDQEIDLEAWVARYVAACLEAEGLNVAPAAPRRRIGA
jgi:hypothetical protein